MSDGNLDRHARRVELAQEELAMDVERLSRAGQDISRRVLRLKTVALLCGGSLLFGAWVARLGRGGGGRALPTTTIVPPRSLARRMFDVMLLEAVRQTSVYMMGRFMPTAPSLLLPAEHDVPHADAPKASDQA